MRHKQYMIIGAAKWGVVWQGPILASAREGFAFLQRMGATHMVVQGVRLEWCKAETGEPIDPPEGTATLVYRGKTLWTWPIACRWTPPQERLMLLGEDIGVHLDFGAGLQVECDVHVRGSLELVALLKADN